MARKTGPLDEREIELLLPYVFPHPTARICVVKPIPGVVGAAFARNSRSVDSPKAVIVREFMDGDGRFDIVRSDSVIARVIVAFGDESVEEEENASAIIGDISNIAVKEIEDRRIGGSPVEKSTRYVFYDQRDAKGSWQYERPQTIMDSKWGPLFRQVTDRHFETYGSLVDPMQAYFRRLKPIEEAEYDIFQTGQPVRLRDLTGEADTKAFRRTYNFDIRTKVCDTIRVILPMSTRTSVALNGNGRFWKNLLIHLYSHQLEEMQQIAKELHAALNCIIPRYVQRAKPSEYKMAVDRAMWQLAHELFGHIPPDLPEAEVVALDNGAEEVGRRLDAMADNEMAIRPFSWWVPELWEREFILNQTAAMLFPYVEHPTTQIRAVLRQMGWGIVDQVRQTYLGYRRNRFDRPGRALEHGYPTQLEYVAGADVYRDLQRHRMLTQQRQLFTTRLGRVIPDEIIDAGFESDLKRCYDDAEDLYEKVRADLGRLHAQYASLFGHNVRWVMEMNDREETHLDELRSGKQGHPRYRRLVQQNHQLLTIRSPQRAAMMVFVDHNEYYWSRADAEARQRAKERRLGIQSEEED